MEKWKKIKFTTDSENFEVDYDFKNNVVQVPYLNNVRFSEVTQFANWVI